MKKENKIDVLWNNVDCIKTTESDIMDYKYCNDIPEDEDVKESDVENWLEESNYDYLNDLRDEFDEDLDNDIIIIADLGLWNGKHIGIKKLSSNMRDIFSTECDYAKWYVDNNDLQCDAYHHDGANHYTYRVVKDGVDIDKFIDDVVYNNKPLSYQRLNYYTKSLKPMVSKILGF